MDLSQHISQQQRQVQRLSPQQIQLVRLLEMSGPELEDEVQRQLDDNPALEKVDDMDSSTPDDDFSESAEQLQRADYRSDEDSPYPSGGYSDSDGDFARDIRAGGQSLQEYLSEQVARSELPSYLTRLAEYIIGNIDSNGYMTRSLMAMENDLAVGGINVPHEMMREAFDAVRLLDPAGVGAVDLRDCLLLQLRRIEPSETSRPDVELATEIVSDYFDLLGKKQFDKLIHELGIKDSEALRRAMDVIRSLDPKPGRLYDNDDVADSSSGIIPDFSVEIESGRANVAFLSTIPRLQVEESFEREASRTPQNPREKQAAAFIRLKRDDAASFISLLQKRADTLMAVMHAIVDLQWNFFASGDRTKIRPMVLRDIAARTGLDISVVSRAIQGKYVSTPAGIFALKTFLNERPTEDPDTSSHILQEAVRQIIENEDPSHPLSDQAICDRLAAQGIEMARRTVTKYRERLGFPSGRLRRKI